MDCSSFNPIHSKTKSTLYCKFCLEYFSRITGATVEGFSCLVQPCRNDHGWNNGRCCSTEPQISPLPSDF